MSIIFNRLKLHVEELKVILKSRSFEVPNIEESIWDTYTYSSAGIRRANLDIIDVIEEKKLYMMHLCVFPHVYDSAPIFGFDVIAGPNKITGAFLDFSNIGDHKLSMWFKSRVADSTWSKQRQLPDWAKSIFSDSMIAAGNISTEQELEEILKISKDCLLYYLNNILEMRPKLVYDELVKTYNFTEQQNFYCKQQKCNPHTPRVLKSLGFTEEQVYEYINNELFPEI